MSQFKVKPAVPKGTRDFLPAELSRRKYLMNTIAHVYHRFGFREIATPVMERMETLSGKYGEEGDKLLFRILNSGDYLKDAPDSLLTDKNSKSLAPHIAEKGLRYDLTVPLARYVVQHQSEIEFPFRRYHIGPVWRADRPQKGRYQEFYQCDADIVGSNSLWNEVELLLIYRQAFEALGFKTPAHEITIRLNHRQLINALAQTLNMPDKFGTMIILLDKLDKAGWEVIERELAEAGFNRGQLDLIQRFCNAGRGESEEAFIELEGLIGHTEAGKTGLSELRFMDSAFRQAGGSGLRIDPSLMRGLDYYTGMIVEVGNPKLFSGSLGGGGRYDKLTELFGGQNMSGVGISFGIERIYDLMEELNLFPARLGSEISILWVPRDTEAEAYTFARVQECRGRGIAAEMFLGNVKKQKHFSYTEAKQIAWLVEVGSDETASERFRLRNTGSRQTTGPHTFDELLAIIS